MTSGKIVDREKMTQFLQIIRFFTQFEKGIKTDISGLFIFIVPVLDGLFTTQ